MSIPNVNKTRISVVTKPTNVSVSSVGIRGKAGEMQNLSNYAVLNGGNTFNGNQTISGSLFVSGSSEFGGDLVPLFARGATLGTELRPFKGVFVSSGSISIASDVIGDPSTTISNVGGNLLISAGGMRLIGDA
jgi:cytoskeletal protein CcmA (bactofilin family)